RRRLMGQWEPNTGASDDWFTPAYIFEALDERFDLDVCANPNPRHVPADAWITHGSLAREWRGFVWMNPPFGARNGIVPWMEKFFAHGDGICLCPDRTSAPWFQRFAKMADAILFLS